ncbi:MAG: hypothetical protein V1855_05050 [bacterium]
MSAWIDGGGGSIAKKIEDVYSGYDLSLVNMIIQKHVDEKCGLNEQENVAPVLNDQDMAFGLCANNTEGTESVLAAYLNHYISDHMSSYDLLTKLGLYAKAFVSYVSDE